MVICLERDADLHMAQLMPVPLTVSCFSKIQIGFTFLVPAHPGSPVQRAVKRVCVYGQCRIWVINYYFCSCVIAYYTVDVPDASDAYNGVGAPPAGYEVTWFVPVAGIGL